MKYVRISFLLVLLVFSHLASSLPVEGPEPLQGRLVELTPPEGRGDLQAITSALPSLGMVVGAYFDSSKGRLILIGNGKHPECSPSLPQIAEAFRYAFAEDQQYPYASIDPFPGNPQAPFMKVVTNDDAWDTEFGWIMYEADRVVKCYSLGRDNITGEEIQSDVAGYTNMLALKLKTKDNPQEMWSRFWLYPKSNAVKATHQAMRIYDATIGIQTETMRWDGEKLVPAEGQRDECAERFAEFFTQHYRAFAEERPILRQVEQLMRLLLVAEWIRKEHIPVDLSWIERVRAQRFRLPRVTPTLIVEGERTSQQGQILSTLSVQLFGGTKLDVVPDYRPPDRGFYDWIGCLQDNAMSKEKGSFSFFDGGNEYTGVIFPAGFIKCLSTEIVTDLEVKLPSERFICLRRRPSLGFEGPNSLGAGWELALPHLYSYNPTGREGKIQKFGIEGQPSIEVRYYELYDAHGERLGRFEKYDIDYLKQRVVVLPTDPRNPWRLYPQSDGVVWAVGPENRLLAFDGRHGVLIGERMGEEMITYEYNNKGVLEKITNRRDTHWIKLILGGNGSYIIGAESSDGQRIWYRQFLPEIQPVHVTVYDEVGQKHLVRINSGNGDWTEEGEAGGAPLDYLDRHASQIAKISRYSTKDRGVVAILEGDGISIFQAGNVVQVLACPARQVERLLARSFESPTVPIFLDNYLERSDLKARRQIVVFSDSYTWQRILGKWIADKLLNVSVFRTKDMNKAKSNLAKHVKTGHRRVEIVLLKETLTQEQSRILTPLEGSSQGTGPEDMIIVIGHRTPDLAEHLDRLGDRVREKFVVLLICGDVENPDALAEAYRTLIDRYDATGVVDFPYKITPEAAKDVAREIMKLSQDGVLRTPAELIREATNRYLQKHPRLKPLPPQVFRWPWGFKERSV